MRESKETIRKRGKAYRELIKKSAVAYLGGKCIQCSYNKCLDALEFHHVNPNTKDFNISFASSSHWSWDKIKIELDKCILVCANCHREIHSI